MKRSLIVLAALAMMMSTAAFADGAADFGAKCAGCHGKMGEGKIGPKIAGKSADEVSAVLTNGGKKGPHAAAFKNVTADQIKDIAAYVAGLK